MGLPEGRAAAPVNGDGVHYNDYDALRNDTTSPTNGQANPAQQPHGTMDATGSRDRSGRQLDPNSEADPRQRSRRRPSGQPRTCGKCQRTLTGQFVRALGDTFHLECFTCNVRAILVIALDDSA